MRDAAPLQEKSPRLSVTVLNYNYARYLPACLDSILGQTMTDYEVIVVNDASTDDSRTVVEGYLHDPRFRLVDHPVNMGYVESLREGSALSRGRYMTVISADDCVVDPDAFGATCGILDARDDVALVYSAWREVGEAGETLSERHSADGDFIRSGVDHFRHQVFDNHVLHSGALIRRASYHSVGGYDARCRYSVDNNMWLALCAVGAVAYVDRVLYAYRSHGSNMSHSSPSLWRATEEILLGIDTALASIAASALPDRARLRRRAYARALVSIPTHDIFAGRIARGWRAYWESFRRYPALTLCQRRTLSLLARSILGQAAFTAGASRLGTRGAGSQVDRKGRSLP